MELFKDYTFSSICLFVAACISVIATVIIFWLICCMARKGYLRYVAHEKANSLARFNERFSSDENIKAVLEELLATENRDSKENKNTKDQRSKRLNEHEMFLRFFEELEYSIRVDSLDKEQVYNLFGYYALYVYRICEHQKKLICQEKSIGVKELMQQRAFIEDYEDRYWRVFRQFCKSMEKIDKKNNKYITDINTKLAPYERQLELSSIIPVAEILTILDEKLAKDTQIKITSINIKRSKK